MPNSEDVQQSLSSSRVGQLNSLCVSWRGVTVCKVKFEEETQGTLSLNTSNGLRGTTNDLFSFKCSGNMCDFRTLPTLMQLQSFFV